MSRVDPELLRAGADVLDRPRTVEHRGGEGVGIRPPIVRRGHRDPRVQALHDQPAGDARLVAEPEPAAVEEHDHRRRTALLGPGLRLPQVQHVPFMRTVSDVRKIRVRLGKIRKAGAWAQVRQVSRTSAARTASAAIRRRVCGRTIIDAPQSEYRRPAGRGRWPGRSPLNPRPLMIVYPTGVRREDFPVQVSSSSPCSIFSLGRVIIPDARSRRGDRSAGIDRGDMPLGPLGVACQGRGRSARAGHAAQGPMLLCSSHADVSRSPRIDTRLAVSASRSHASGGSRSGGNSSNRDGC